MALSTLSQGLQKGIICPVSMTETQPKHPKSLIPKSSTKSISVVVEPEKSKIPDIQVHKGA